MCHSAVVGSRYVVYNLASFVCSFLPISTPPTISPLMLGWGAWLSYLSHLYTVVMPFLSANRSEIIPMPFDSVPCHPQADTDMYWPHTHSIQKKHSNQLTLFFSQHRKIIKDSFQITQAME